MIERNLPSAYLFPPLTESLPTVDKTERFKFTTEESLAEFAEGVVPLSTSRSTKWALKNFSEWMEQRNSRYLIYLISLNIPLSLNFFRYPEEPVPDTILESSDPKLLNKHLSRYAVETRKANGSFYPPSSVDYSDTCGPITLVVLISWIKKTIISLSYITPWILSSASFILKGLVEEQS